MQETELKFFYDNMLQSTAGTLIATSTSTGIFAIDNVHNMLEVNRWKASSSATQNLDFDAGVGNSFDMNYIAILGHNLSGATISVIHSTSTSYSTSGSTAGTALSTTVPSNSVFLREFAAPGASRFTRIQISGMTTAPRIDVLSLGTASTIAFIQPPFDPYGQNTKTNISMTEGGYIAGIHSKFTERRINLRFNGVTTALYNIFNTWHENSGQKNFFMAWDSTGDSSAVYLVRPSERFMNSINVDQFRNVTINLKGRKE